MTLIKNLKLTNKLGLHARAAAKFVKTAAQFTCDIAVCSHGKKADAKNIMELMMLTLGCGAEFEAHFEGKDENAAATALEKLITGKFGEAE